MTPQDRAALDTAERERDAATMQAMCHGMARMTRAELVEKMARAYEDTAQAITPDEWWFQSRVTWAPPVGLLGLGCVTATPAAGGSRLRGRMVTPGRSARRNCRDRMAISVIWSSVRCVVSGLLAIGCFLPAVCPHPPWPATVNVSGRL